MRNSVLSVLFLCLALSHVTAGLLCSLSSLSCVPHPRRLLDPRCPRQLCSIRGWPIRDSGVSSRAAPSRIHARAANDKLGPVIRSSNSSQSPAPPSSTCVRKLISSFPPTPRHTGNSLVKHHVRPNPTPRHRKRVQQIPEMVLLPTHEVPPLVDAQSFVEPVVLVVGSFCVLWETKGAVGG